MEEEGHKIIKLNIGNLAAFGLEPPDEIVQDMIRNLPHAAGYTDSKGLFAPRKAVMHYTQEKHITGVTVDDIYLGNGASELIVMSMNALLNDGDEVLVPAPDYPLWTAAVALSGGTPVHYLCDERPGWLPDIDDIAPQDHAATRKAHRRHQPEQPDRRAVSRRAAAADRRARAPAPADRLRRRDLRQDAVRRRDAHVASPSLADDVLFVTFNGLSKNYRSCGYRAGWMVGVGRKAPCARLHRGPEHARLDAPVRQHAGPVRDPDRARRLPEHQRPGRAGRAPVPAARPRVRAADARFRA